MNEITRMYQNHPVRIVDKDGETWFAAKDVSDILGYRDAYNMTRRLDEDEKDTHLVSTPSGDQEMLIISEAGLYQSILGSKKKEAKDFTRLVTHDVLPSIRRTGTYVAPQSAAPINGANMQRLLDIMQNFSEIAHENARLAERNCYLSQFEPRSEYGDPNDDGVPCYQKRRGYFVSRKGADVVKKNPEKETFEQLDLFYDRLPGILLETFKRTLNQLSEGK